MPVYTVAGVEVDFPFDAYPVQLAYMEKVVLALEHGRNALLESPTGTGKTLSLLCAALGWRRAHAERLRGRVFMYELPQDIVRQSESWMWRQWGRSGGRGCDPVYNRRIYAAQTHFDAHLMRDDAVRTLDPYAADLFFVPLFTSYGQTSNTDCPPH